jgi:lipopolysaccharide/colanic/teichoic acid biosynthesis glycosyltransferase
MYLEDVLPQKLTMAEQYIRDHSLFGDIALLFRTVYAVVTGD